MYCRRWPENSWHRPSNYHLRTSLPGRRSSVATELFCAESSRSGSPNRDLFFLTGIRSPAIAYDLSAIDRGGGTCGGTFQFLSSLSSRRHPHLRPKASLQPGHGAPISILMSDIALIRTSILKPTSWESRLDWFSIPIPVSEWHSVSASSTKTNSRCVACFVTS